MQTGPGPMHVLICSGACSIILEFTEDKYTWYNAWCNLQWAREHCSEVYGRWVYLVWILFLWIFIQFIKQQPYWNRHLDMNWAIVDTSHLANRDNQGMFNICTIGGRHCFDQLHYNQVYSSSVNFRTMLMNPTADHTMYCINLCIPR